MSTKTIPGELAEKAALLECSVQKPGNVGPDKDFEDTSYADFIASARILGESAGKVAAGKLSIGEGVLDYVSRSLEKIGVNAHLGTAILVMPLARAAGDDDYEGVDVLEHLDHLHRTLEHVLENADNNDAVLVYRAIRKMRPGGLRDPHFAGDDIDVVIGEIEQGGFSYRDWMALGAEKDGIAKETRDGYPRVFYTAKRFLENGIDSHNILLEYLLLLSQKPDTFVIGKRGDEPASMIMRMAAKTLKAEGTGTFATNLQELDEYCRRKRVNPGTTADIIGASLYAALLTEKSE